MKKKIPLELRNSIEDIFRKYPGVASIHKNDSVMLHMIDGTGSDLTFYFIIFGLELENGKTKYKYQVMPYNTENFQQLNETSNFDRLSDMLNNWMNLLIQYNIPSPVFDDPITQKYYDDLEIQFKIVDEDADFAPHTWEQQIKLIDILDQAKERIKKEVNPNNEEIVDDIIADIESAKQLMGQSTKKENISRLRKIISKTGKISTQVATEILFSLMTDAAKIAIGMAAGALLG